MNMKKLEHFKEYYLKSTLIGAVAISVLLYILFHSMSSNDNHSLRIAVFDNICTQEEMDEMQSSAETALEQAGITEPVIIDNSYSSSSERDYERFYVLASNNDVDAVIADETVFEDLAAKGYFTDLDDVVSSKDQLIFANGYKDTDEISFEDHETGQGDSLPYGLQLNNYVLSFVASSPNETAFTVFSQTLMEDGTYAE